MYVSHVIRLALCLFAFLVLFHPGTYAQSATFSKFFWQQDDDISGNYIMPFHDGYMLAQGRKMPGKDRINICLSRLNSQADTIWNRIFEDTLYDYSIHRINITSDHHLLITGNVDDPVVIGKERAFVLKTDTLGNKIWMKEFGYFASWALSEGNDIIEIPGNAYLMGGYRLSSSAADLGGMIIYKIDTAGNEIWTSYAGSSGDHAKSILYNPSDSGFYVTGINYHYDADERQRAGLFRYNKNGMMLWRKHYGSEVGKRLVYQDSGIVILTNRKLIKTDLNGDSIWARDFSFQLSKIIYYPGSSLEDMTRTTDGGFVIGGYSLEGYRNWQIAGQSANYKIIKTDASGIEQWNKSVSIGARNEYLLSVIETRDTGLILCGTSADAYNAKGDTWLVKTDLNGNQQTCTMFIEKRVLSETYCPPEASAFKFYYSVPYDSSRFYTFTWTRNDTLIPGETGQYVELLKAGTYKAYATDTATGCLDSSGLMSVAFSPPPAGFTAGPDILRCLGPGSATINLSSQGKPFGGGKWTGPDLTFEGDNSVNPNNLGYGSHAYVFSMMLNNSTCVFKDTMNIVLDTVKPVKPVITSDKAQPMCKGDTVKLSIPAGYMNIVWSTRNINIKSDSLNAKYKDSTLAWVFATTAGLVCRDSASYRISFNPVEPDPVVVITGPAEFCEGDSSKLTTTISYDYYRWFSGDTTGEVYAKTTDIYMLRAKQINTCLSSWSNIIDVWVNKRPETPAIVRASAGILECTTVADFYTWYLNDSILPAHTRQLTTTTDGTYTVTTQLTSFECESFVSAPYVLETTSLGERQSLSFRTYPNPVKKYLTIEHVYPGSGEYTLNVFSVIGEKVFTGSAGAAQQTETDLSFLAPGNYVLMIQHGSGVYRTLFVKE